MKPILFNTDMVRRLLNGEKTVTRRVVKPQPREIYHDRKFYEEDGDLFVLAEHQNGECFQIVPPYSLGDILYVRETWNRLLGEWIYKADQKPGFKNPGKWRPSIHMPRETARIFLRVTDVRVERLQEIAPEQLRAEGFPIFVTPSECENSFNRFGAVCDYKNKLEKFSDLWDSTIKPADRDLYGWEANPWVWVIEFELISREEAQKGEVVDPIGNYQGTPLEGLDAFQRQLKRFDIPSEKIDRTEAAEHG